MSASPATVLIVDDTPSNIDVLRAMLGDLYLLKVATNGERAIALARAEPAPDLILLDVMMPGLDGYTTCRRLKADARTARIPVIFVTAKHQVEDETEGFAAGGVDYIVKPVSEPLVRARIKTHIELYNQKRLLANLVAERTRELQMARLEIIRRLGRAAEYKDDETGGHISRMAQYARLLALEVGLSAREAEAIFIAAPMHDVGKIGVPDHILRKAGPLDEAEWKIMRTHPSIGASIIGEHDDLILSYARTIALTHHERWDGSGYPQGLAGEAIPIAGRIVALCDVFDALGSARAYKPAWPIEQVDAFVRAQAGTHFDPGLIAPYVRLLPEFARIRAESEAAEAAAEQD